MNETEGLLQRIRSCCGHTSGEHLVRFADPVKGTGVSHYCNTCRATCRSSATVTRGMGSPWGALTPFVKPTSGGSSSSPRRIALSGKPMAAPPTRRSPFDDLIADLQRDAVSKPTALAPIRRSAPVRRGAFDDLVDGLRRYAAPMQQTRSAPASTATSDEDIAIVIMDDDGVHRIRRSPLARLADELLEASKPPEMFPTREEVRARMKELNRAREERQHQRRLAEIRAYAEGRREISLAAAELEAASR